MLFRRVPTIVGWWDAGGHHLQNYATGKTAEATADDVEALNALDEWRTAAGVASRTRRTVRATSSTLRRLVALGFVERSDQRASRVQDRMAAWADWNPAAGFFHFATRDMTFMDVREGNALVNSWHATDPLPPATKTIKGPRTSLPPYQRSGAFPSVLLSRRSWRRFSRKRIPLATLSTLLGLTWATQRWIHVGDDRLALKTSPSGGAIHSLEVYAAVRDVQGLKPRVYHYDPDAHALVALRQRWDDGWIAKCLGGQEFFANANVVVFMTSVFDRVQWKYRFPRAYRVVLLEAGHFCQTFCLTATWLGLAPFCTAALGDSIIERAIGVDGVNESVLYAMGVGTRPANTPWAPWPYAPIVLPTTRPTHLAGGRGQRRQEGR